MSQFALTRLDKDILLLRLMGRWRLGGSSGISRELEEELHSFSLVSRVVFDSGKLIAWDSGILTSLKRSAATVSPLGGDPFLGILLIRPRAARSRVFRDPS